MKDEKKQQQNI